MYEVLKNKIKNYEAQGIEIKINEDHKIVAVITPIMRRSHTMDFAKEIIFVDSSGSCDQTNTVVTFFFGSSKVGGIHLGIVFHINQTEENYLSAFKVLKELIGSSGFGGQSKPKVFMTDDSVAERKALKLCYPITLLLCTFHILQAVWRWLWSSKNDINPNDRKHLMNLFRRVVYSSNEVNCVAEKEKLNKDDIFQKYTNFQE